MSALFFHVFHLMLQDRVSWLKWALGPPLACWHFKWSVQIYLSWSLDCMQWNPLEIASVKQGRLWPSESPPAPYYSFPFSGNVRPKFRMGCHLSDILWGLIRTKALHGRFCFLLSNCFGSEAFLCDLGRSHIIVATVVGSGSSVCGGGVKSHCSISQTDMILDTTLAIK